MVDKFQLSLYFDALNGDVASLCVDENEIEGIIIR